MVVLLSAVRACTGNYLEISRYHLVKWKRDCSHRTLFCGFIYQAGRLGVSCHSACGVQQDVVSRGGRRVFVFCGNACLLLLVFHVAVWIFPDKVFFDLECASACIAGFGGNRLLGETSRNMFSASSIASHGSDAVSQRERGALLCGYPTCGGAVIAGGDGLDLLQKAKANAGCDRRRDFNIFTAYNHENDIGHQ